jgi:hypothetical protein
LSQLSAVEQKRIHLLCDNVLTAQTPPVDMVMALNFSFCIFKKRTELKHYFQTAVKSLHSAGIFILDIYGGTESIIAKSDDTREIDGFTAPDGTQIPSFEYTWEQAKYNPINHHTTCHIHFKVPNIGKIEKAFTYDWRLWTLPELQEILLEAGFSKAEVYLHDFNDEGESDETFRLRKNYENAQGWIAYVVGVK